MRLTIVIPPSDPVTLQEAKAFMHVDTTADDDVITALIAAVQDWLSGLQGWLGRALHETTFKLTIPHFPPHPLAGIPLPRPPLIAVGEIAYVDENGVEQTLVNTWRAITCNDGIDYIVLKSGEAWPLIDPDTEVTIIYRAGYVDGQSPPQPNLPEGLKQAVLMAVARLYASSHTVGLPIHTDEFMARLFAPYRVFA